MGGGGLRGCDVSDCEEDNVADEGEANTVVSGMSPEDCDDVAELLRDANNLAAFRLALAAIRLEVVLLDAAAELGGGACCCICCKCSNCC